MSEPKTEFDLNERGTRFTHWFELKELFNEGIEAIGRIQKQYLSKNDEILAAELRSAVTLIEKQLDRASQYDRKVWTVGNTVNSLPKNPEEIRG